MPTTRPHGGRIGRYELKYPLGSGAFATVWLGSDDALDVPVAIKILADNWSLNEDVRERFLTEARLLRRITSPRAVSVYDVGEADGRPYFVMDYVDGGTLAEVIPSEVDAAERLRLAAETAYAVHELHLAGVAHRDIKPSNLLIDRTVEPAHVLVTDLGTAKSLADGSGFTMTAGTPAYMAPEQVHGTAGIDARADVYAIGVVTYELLTARRPFEVTHLTALTERSADARPDPVAALLGLPPEVDDLLLASLSLDPAARPSDAKEFGDALAALSVRAGGMETTLVPPPMPPEGPSLPPVVPDKAPTEWPIGLVLFIAVLMFAIAAGAAWFFLSR